MIFPAGCANGSECRTAVSFIQINDLWALLLSYHSPANVFCFRISFLWLIPFQSCGFFLVLASLFLFLLCCVRWQTGKKDLFCYGVGFVRNWNRRILRFALSSFVPFLALVDMGSVKQMLPNCNIWKIPIFTMSFSSAVPADFERTFVFLLRQTPFVFPRKSKKIIVNPRCNKTDTSCLFQKVFLLN